MDVYWLGVFLARERVMIAGILAFLTSIEDEHTIAVVLVDDEITPDHDWA
jgi:hypothetical protein